MTSQQQPKRKPHRRGQAKLSGPTGSCFAAAAAVRQCCICRESRPQGQLLQLDAVPADGAEAASARKSGRHSYVCVARACLTGAARRMAGKKVSADEAHAALAVPLTLLATKRLIETIGLARRQGLLVMGASRIVALRPSTTDLYLDDVDDDDDDDEDDDDDADDGDIEVTINRAHEPDAAADAAPPPTDTVVDGAETADVDVLALLEPEGQQDVVLLAIDAARRTARRLGPTALPSMLCGADMGRAAGGAPVAAVGIPKGRLALQAAYWLRVWYEARAVLTTPESMMN